MGTSAENGTGVKFEFQIKFSLSRDISWPVHIVALRQLSLRLSSNLSDELNKAQAVSDMPSCSDDSMDPVFWTHTCTHVPRSIVMVDFTSLWTAWDYMPNGHPIWRCCQAESHQTPEIQYHRNQQALLQNNGPHGVKSDSVTKLRPSWYCVGLHSFSDPFHIDLTILHCNVGPPYHIMDDTSMVFAFCEFSCSIECLRCWHSTGNFQ